MAIIRRCKRQSNFTIIDNDVLRDSRMSWKAQGILTYCLSLPDNWEINIKHLSRLRPDGRDSTMSGLKELKQLGYIRKVRITDDSGRIVKWETQIFDVPQLLDQNTGNPHSGNATMWETQNTGNPHSGIGGDIINTVSKKDLDQRKKKKEEERERALSLSEDFSFSENQDGAEQENPGSQDLDQSPPEDSTVNEEDLNSQKKNTAAPQNNEAWDVDVLNKIWEANKSPKWKPSSLLILTKFISAGLDQFLATAGGNRSEAYRLIGIAIAQMSTDEFYGTRDRRLSEVLHFDPQQPCKTFCGHWLGAALEVAGGAKKPAAEKPIEKLTHDISDRLIPRIAETNVADPHAKPDTNCPECGMRSRAFEVERYGTCAFCWQKQRTHHSPVGLIAKTD